MTYLVIAIGGALGSVLRAWIGAVMVGLTGPQFPWGTILINVVGSFAIGFFGTLTATDGRFAAGADLRAFVMVGICGGFTTFSSFSLQTADLARDGRPGQALANVVLSVALCLGAVAAGSSAALLARTAGPVRLGAAAFGGGGTVVALQWADTAGPMLEAARRIAALRPGPATALVLDPPVLAGYQPTEEVMTRERRAERPGASADRVGALRPLLDGWVGALRADGRRARWTEVKGGGLRAFREHGVPDGLLVLAHGRDRPGSLDQVRALTEGRHGPVLLLPPGWTGAVGRVVLLVPDRAGGGDRLLLPLPGRPERRVEMAPSAGAHAILARAADEKADLLAIGTGDRAGTGASDVPHDVVAGAAIPVLLVPGPA